MVFYGIGRSTELYMIFRGRLAQQGDIAMGGIASVLYGALVYLLFFGTILYAIAFVGNLPVPKTIDSGEAGPLVPALIDQHAAARAVCHPAQRHGAARVQALVDAASCRSRSSARPMCCSRAWCSSLLYWQWRPMPGAGLVGDQPGRRCRPQAIFWSAGPSCCSAPS